MANSGVPPSQTAAQSPAALLPAAGARAAAVSRAVATRTVTTDPAVDEATFFELPDGTPTVVDRYDLEKAVPSEAASHLVERDRYWVNKPYAFVSIFHSRRDNERKYYLIEPHLSPAEADLRSFLATQLRRSITLGDTDEAVSRETVIERETRRLLDRYGLVDTTTEAAGLGRRLWRRLATTVPVDIPGVVDDVRPTLDAAAVEKLLYVLKRDFLGYERIDGITHDPHVEDISCDGYNAPVFVYHSEYGQLLTNVTHGETELDDFVVKLAQRSNNGISKRQPQVDATLPNGARAHLTLGCEVADHGTNYTIRQFTDVPHTPIDLINWGTFSIEQLAFLWLAIENNKNILFAGGTASGKTTSLNAVSLFIPSDTKVVSIEDTREVALPHRNWVASVTRPAFTPEAAGDIDAFDLLEGALRQRPEYIIMGEVRGEEGRTLFQVMSTGHTTCTTFHADSVEEVLKRFTTSPIDVPKTMFTALDLVSVQAQTRVDGQTVRRATSITEINQYDADSDQLNVRQLYQWHAADDTFRSTGRARTLDAIKFDRGWSDTDLEQAMFARQVVLAALIDRGLTDYAAVATTIQAFMHDPETVLTLLATDRLESALESLSQMESIDVSLRAETPACRPDPAPSVTDRVQTLLDRAERELFPAYRGSDHTTAGQDVAVRSP